MTDELNEAQEGMTKVGAMLALTVETALARALDPARGTVASCRCIMASIFRKPDGRGRQADERVETDRRAMICPQHPEALWCDDPWCIRRHVELQHADDDPVARCFACEREIPEDKVTPVFAVVQLHRAVPICYSVQNEYGAERKVTYSGDLWTYPVTYLCPEHAGLVELPIRMGWPMGYAS